MDVDEFKKLKVIDWAQKGNLVRLYLGDADCADYCGDDWDDTPYEHNAGHVYQQYIKGFIDVLVDFACDAITPEDIYTNSPYSKNDFKSNDIPFMFVIDYGDVLNDMCYTMENDWNDYVNPQDISVETHIVGVLRFNMTVDDIINMFDSRITVLDGYAYTPYRRMKVEL